jgi:two-component sensor histidine kinase
LTGGLTERDAAFERLREAYMDLEAAKPLRELGRSAAFINHEIKNYMMVISGYAALLLRSKKLDEKDRAMAENIAATVAKLHDFSMSVLELSRPEAASGEEEVELVQRLRLCIDVNFPERASDISVSCNAPQNAVLINCNPEKLERAVINAIRNSLEAGARNVSVKLSACNQTALVVIEDDGAGCGAEHLQNLSTTFFTTKGGNETGLGLCTIRSIVEAHNGCVSIYAKNVLGGGKQGLSMQILLPASKKTPYEAAKTEITLVKDGLPDTSKIIKMLKNLKITPRVAKQVSEIGGEGQNSLLDSIIIAAASKAEEIKEQMKSTGDRGKVKVLSIVEAESGIPLVVGDDGNADNWELLTEEYIIGSFERTTSD